MHLARELSPILKCSEVLHQRFTRYPPLPLPTTLVTTHKEYFLIHCSNNDSANSLAQNEAKQLKRNRIDHPDILKWFGKK
jgi:hypothetical protein